VSAVLALYKPLENIVHGISPEYANSGNGTSPAGFARRTVNISVKTSIIATGWMTAQRIPSLDRR
jgi:hypothetical protein